MIDLKPCPFCGGEPYFLKPRHEKGTAFDTMMIECKHCGALPYGVSVYDGKKEEDKKAAIAKFWNRRSNDWISVKERLPEKETFALLFSVDGEVYYGSFGYSKFYAFDSSGIFAAFATYEVSHWQYLPEPPEEVNKNDEP